MLEHSNKTSVFSFAFCSKTHTIRLSLAIKYRRWLCILFPSLDSISMFIIRIISLQKRILFSLSKEFKENWRQSQISIPFMGEIASLSRKELFFWAIEKSGFFVLFRDTVDFLLYIYNNSVIYFLFKYYGKRKIPQRRKSPRNYLRWWRWGRSRNSACFCYLSLYACKFLRLFCRIPTSLQKSQSRSLFFFGCRDSVFDCLCLRSVSIHPGQKSSKIVVNSSKK